MHSRDLNEFQTVFTAIIESLLESFKHDKDEGVKSTVESALIRIADKRPNELLCILCDNKTNNHQKIDVTVNACILRYVFMSKQEMNHFNFFLFNKQRHTIYCRLTHLRFGLERA